MKLKFTHHYGEDTRQKEKKRKGHHLEEYVMGGAPWQERLAAADLAIRLQNLCRAAM